MEYILILKLNNNERSSYEKTGQALAMTLRTLAVLFSFLFLLNPNNLSAQTDSLQYVLGKFNPATHSQFEEIPASSASRSGMYLRKEALSAFIKMKKAAKENNIELKILSAARNFTAQKGIWEAKWNGTRKVNGQNLKQAISDPAERAKKILKYSSMPGTSRHHWGTDIDINSLSPTYFASGKGKKEYDWLCEYAHQFGFCQVYSVKGKSRPNGYEEEKWHWSYLPIATQLLRFYVENISAENISGFDGSNALPFSETRKYVLGIAEDCK
ncbi:MAG: M15 family metallopeptidase [Flavobacteriales bacterium]|nr:M15 family metallopeptidase [Flavobacteriales bacterium]